MQRRLGRSSQLDQTSPKDRELATEIFFVLHNDIIVLNRLQDLSFFRFYISIGIRSLVASAVEEVRNIAKTRA